MRWGPRNRRRLAVGGSLALGAAVVGVVLVLTTGGTSRSTPRSVPVTERITFGATKQQVLRLVGKPAATQGRCWQYAVKAGKIGSLALPPHYLRFYVGVDTVRVCFFGAGVSDMHEHMFFPRRHGKPIPKWIPMPSLP